MPVATHPCAGFVGGTVDCNQVPRQTLKPIHSSNITGHSLDYILRYDFLPSLIVRVDG